MASGSRSSPLGSPAERRSPLPSPTAESDTPVTDRLGHPLGTAPEVALRNRSPSPNSLLVPGQNNDIDGSRSRSGSLTPQSATSRSRSSSHDGSSTATSRSAAAGSTSAQPTSKDWSRATIGYGGAGGGGVRSEAAEFGTSPSAANQRDNSSGSQMASSKTYHSLSYAPRQRQSILRTNHPVFQSHSSQFQQQQQQQQSSAAAGETAKLSASPSFPSFIGRQVPTQSESKVSTKPQPASASASSATSSSAAATAAMSLAKMQLAQMREAARQIGLSDKSAGWMMLEALQAATDGEWAAIAALVASGEATLLLPKEPPSVFSSGSRLSLSFAHDHLIFDPSASSSRPSPSALSAALPLDAEPPSIVTLSGLRGQIQHRQQEDVTAGGTTSRVVMRSFVPRADGVVGVLQNVVSRRELLDGLAPLPVSSDPSLDSAATLAFPTFELGIYKSDFPLPPPFQSERTHARKRTQSNSRLNTAGSRASASFASLFGGSGRDRAKKPSTEAQGAELLDASKLAAPSLDGVADESQGSGRPSAGARSMSEGADGGKASADEDVKAGEETSKLTSSVGTAVEDDVPSTNPARPQRTIAVWVVDRVIRRSSVLRGVGKVVAGRISEQLRRANFDESVIQVVSSFSAMFVPPVVQASGAVLPGAEAGNLGQWPSTGSASSNRTSSASSLSPSAVANAPYLSGPDEMSENFQDFFASLRSQLESVEQERLERKFAALQEPQTEASLQEQQATMDKADAMLEIVESAVTEEVYDRIFCPPTSRDDYHDDALASRIAALNVLGISLSHLGLKVPAGTTNSDAGSMSPKTELDQIVAACGEELQKLQSPRFRSPKAKLEVLVAAHRRVVDGLSKLPGIQLKDEDEVSDGINVTDSDDATTADAKEMSTSAEADTVKTLKTETKSSSADLILPVLIYSIVTANPPKLASNLFFIQRFRAENLVQGESAYCLVNVQAAVAFLENVDVKDLGLDASRVAGFSPVQVSSASPDRGARITSTNFAGPHGFTQDARASDAAATSAARELANPDVELSMPLRLRGRLTQEIGDLAGISNKVITGVMGSSISAFGRMMGAGMAAGNETWERSRAEGPKTLEEIRGALSGNRSRRPSSASAHAPAGNDTGDDDDAEHPANGTADERQEKSDARSIRSAESGRPRRRTGTDASNTISASYDGAKEKPSIGDRLASLPMLGRFGGNSSSTTPVHGSPAQASGGNLLASPSSITRELPGPPPPQKQPSRPAHGRTSSYLATFARSAGRSDKVSTEAASREEINIPASLQSPYPKLSKPPTTDRPVHIVLACTGSVASVKVVSIVEELMQYANIRVQVVPTASSLHFVDRAELQRITESSGDGGVAEAQQQKPYDGRAYTVRDLAAENLAAVRAKNGQALSADSEDLYLPRVHLWTDEDEWKDWKKLGDPVLHIELRRWADIVLVAPCSANTLAKINGGICDSLLTSFLRALSSGTPTLLFPAMNTLMYMHPLTSRHIAFVKEVLGYEVIGPIEKKLACGDIGAGAMFEWLSIVGIVVDRFGLVPRHSAVSTTAVGEEEGDGEGKTMDSVEDAVQAQ